VGGGAGSVGAGGVVGGTVAELMVGQYIKRDGEAGGNTVEIANSFGGDYEGDDTDADGVVVCVAGGDGDFCFGVLESNAGAGNGREGQAVCGGVLLQGEVGARG